MASVDTVPTAGDVLTGTNKANILKKKEPQSIDDSVPDDFGKYTPFYIFAIVGHLC